MIVHFWELPGNRTYIVLKRFFRDEFLKRLGEKNYPAKILNKIKNGKVKIIQIVKISEEQNIPLEEIEQNISWVGGNNSKGLSNPKFPINFLNRAASRFIAAIVNDGTLTNERATSYGRLMYDNFDESLRNSVLKDFLAVFGGKPNEIAFRNAGNKKYLEFSSVIRDLVELVITHKGPKSESNLKVPRFILENKDLVLGWLEQTIADEGDVKHYPAGYRRAIVWRRSLDVSRLFQGKVKRDISLRKLPEKVQEVLQKQKCNLISAEEKMLGFLGIGYRRYNLGLYITAKKMVRTRWQISITKRTNLLKLRGLITIPSKSKDRKLSLITNGFLRFKEPLKVRTTVLELGRDSFFTSTDLKKRMNYKEVNTANKWLNLFEKQGLIKKTKESLYGCGYYRRPAEYMLILGK